MPVYFDYSRSTPFECANPEKRIVKAVTSVFTARLLLVVKRGLALPKG
jgi:hypothetical protein